MGRGQRGGGSSRHHSLTAAQYQERHRAALVISLTINLSAGLFPVKCAFNSTLPLLNHQFMMVLFFIPVQIFIAEVNIPFNSSMFLYHFS